MTRDDREQGKEGEAGGGGAAVGARPHSPDGVDLTLIRWMLSMTPRQRLETLQDIAWSILRLRNGAAKT